MLMHTPSCMGRFGDFATLFYYHAIRDIVSCKTALQTAISHSHYDKSWCTLVININYSIEFSQWFESEIFSDCSKISTGNERHVIA